MPAACIKLLHREPYQGHVFADLLPRLGYKVEPKPRASPKPGDLFLTWGRQARDEATAALYEEAGATVLVVENGYWGRNFRGGPWYALARGQHNGCGTWPAASAARWEAMGIDLAPWRTRGREIVILAQRGIGSARVKEPLGWVDETAALLRRTTGRPVRIRAHPGPQCVVPPVSLRDDLADAWAAVTWGSSAGLHALALGVPVFHGLPCWIGRTAARHIGADIERPYMGDRLPMFHRLASAMWTLDEIVSGEALAWLRA